MKYGLLSATALTTTAVFLVPNVAAAQDFDWTGVYVGAGLGVDTFQDTIATDSNSPEFVPFGETFGGDPDLFGWVGVGGNWDTGMFVLGVEADYNSLGRMGSTSIDQPGEDAFEQIVGEAEYTLDQLLTARVRAGVSLDRLMLFATAGLAAGNASLSTSYQDCGKILDPCDFDSASGEASAWLPGLAVGLGAEYAPADNVSLKVDALWYQLDPLSVEATGGDDSYTAMLSPHGFLVRGGINVHLK